MNCEKEKCKLEKMAIGSTDLYVTSIDNEDGTYSLTLSIPDVNKNIEIKLFKVLPYILENNKEVLLHLEETVGEDE